MNLQTYQNLIITCFRDIICILIHEWNPSIFARVFIILHTSIDNSLEGLVKSLYQIENTNNHVLDWISKHLFSLKYFYITLFNEIWIEQ